MPSVESERAGAVNLESSDRELLLAVYQLERQEEQSANTAYGVLLAAALTILGGVSVILFRSDVPGWGDAILPLVPLPLLAACAGLLKTGQFRGAYIDRCEELLQREIGGLPVPAGHRRSHRHYRKSREGRLNSSIVTAVLAALYIVIVVQSARAATTSAKKHWVSPSLSSPSSSLPTSRFGLSRD
jgi:hypothetical protein